MVIKFGKIELNGRLILDTELRITISDFELDGAIKRSYAFTTEFQRYFTTTKLRQCEKDLSHGARFVFAIDDYNDAHLAWAKTACACGLIDEYEITATIYKEKGTKNDTTTDIFTLDKETLRFIAKELHKALAKHEEEMQKKERPGSTLLFEV